MALTYEQLTSPNYDVMNDAAIDETWKYLVPYASFKSVIAPSISFYNRISPFTKEILAGSNLWLRRPYKWMNAEQKRQLATDGEAYYKKYMHDHPVNTPIGEIDFKNNRASETRAEYMWQYPFVRYKLSNAKDNTKIPNVKKDKIDRSYFDNLKIDLFGRSYDYQIRNNPKGEKDFYNIKPYDLLNKNIEDIKKEPDLFNKFLELNKKGL